MKHRLIVLGAVLCAVFAVVVVTSSIARAGAGDDGIGGCPRVSAAEPRLYLAVWKGFAGEGIYVLERDGHRRITSGSDRSASVSPDGRRLLIYGEEDGEPGYFVSCADGSRRARISQGLHPINWLNDHALIIAKIGGELSVYDFLTGEESKIVRDPRISLPGHVTAAGSTAVVQAEGKVMTISWKARFSAAAVRVEDGLFVGGITRTGVLYAFGDTPVLPGGGYGPNRRLWTRIASARSWKSVSDTVGLPFTESATSDGRCLVLVHRGPRPLRPTFVALVDLRGGHLGTLVEANAIRTASTANRCDVLARLAR